MKVNFKYDKHSFQSVFRLFGLSSCAVVRSDISDTPVNEHVARCIPDSERITDLSPQFFSSNSVLTKMLFNIILECLEQENRNEVIDFQPIWLRMDFGC